MSVHTDCVEKVFTKCLKGKMCDQDKSKTPLMNINIPHKWETKTFTRPTMCKHCGQLIFGFYKQGVYCKACKMAAHKKCMDQIGTDNYIDYDNLRQSCKKDSKPNWVICEIAKIANRNLRKSRKLRIFI